MKAKEIVANIRQKLSVGGDAHEVFTDELVADVHRMRAQNEARKGQEAAQARTEKAMAVSDPVLAYIKTTLGL